MTDMLLVHHSSLNALATLGTGNGLHLEKYFTGIPGNGSLHFAKE
jgi:hypothetical protein